MGPSRCQQELCPNWSGDGDVCPCALFDLTPGTDRLEGGPSPVTGLTCSRRAVADAAGWPWCDEHNRPRWDGVAPCSRLHPKPPAITYDDDGSPEPPFGGQYR